MKTVCKRKALSLDCLDSIRNEKVILEKANHPFIPKLRHTFENDRKIFFLFNHIEGEKLSYVLYNMTRFSEEITKFYAAEILATLEYLHKEMKVSYRGLKAKNIILDSEGHINFLDFAQARPLDFENASEKEIASAKRKDFWHLGCLIYELLSGKKLAKTKREVPQTLKEETLKESFSWPKHISSSARSLIVRLLSLKSEETLDDTTIEEIKKHPFFHGLSWKKIGQRLSCPPISPHKHRRISCETVSDGSSLKIESSDFCELDEIMTKRPQDIRPDTEKGESFNHDSRAYNHFEDKLESKKDLLFYNRS